MAEQLKIGGKLWKPTGIKLKPGIYSPEGEYLGSLDDISKNQKGNLVVTKSGEIRKVAIVFGHPQLGPTKFNTKSISNIPQPLRKHATETRVEAKWIGSGRKRRLVPKAGGETKVFKYQGDGFVSKDSPSIYHATKEQQKIIDTHWKIKTEPPNPLNFDYKDGVSAEYNIAKARFEIWQKRRKEYGGEKGLLFSSGEKGSNNKDQYYYVSEGGYQEGMEDDDWKPRALSGVVIDNDGNSKVVPLSKIFANDPIGTLQYKDHVKYQEHINKTPPIVSDVNPLVRVKPGDNLASTNGLVINQKPKPNGSKPNNTVYQASESKTALNNIASYKQDATTSWGRGSFNTKGTTTNLTSRNERTLAYWSGDQKSGGMGYDFSKFKGDTKQLARDLRTGRAWETGKGTIIYQPDRGGMQVFKQRT